MASAVIPGAVVAALTLAVNLGLDRLLPATAPALLRLAAIGLVSGAILFASWRATRFLLPNSPLERALKGA